MEKKAPIPRDPKERLEAILDRDQVNTNMERKPKVRSHLTMDAFGSRTMQITTRVVNEEGISYNLSTLDLGIAT